MTLPLRGHAITLRGMESSQQQTSVIRLRSVAAGGDVEPNDFFLVRSRDDLSSVTLKPNLAVIADEDLESFCRETDCKNLIGMPSKFGYLSDGDIIGFDRNNGHFRTLYRRASKHNSFLVTDRCNHYCLMCSQPPKDVDDRWILDEIRKALPLVSKQTEYLCFTGGEPLLDWREFAGVLSVCRDELPNTLVHVLSNGRAFARDEVAAAWSDVQHPHLSVGIPIYSAIDHVHDYVVQAQGAFDETVLGILKLKNKGQRVEIRVVLHAITAPRIVETCRWLARNMPFVDHVALMGLEHTGFTLANLDKLWIDPVDYKKELADAVKVLASANVAVSVYNLQRCVLDRSVWPYARQSISDWKNDYVEECDRCIEKVRCSGFFTTGRPTLSRGVKAILAS